MKSSNYTNYTLDVPLKEGAKGYVGMFFEMFLKVASTLQNPEFSKEPMAVYYQVCWIVDMIPDDSHRLKIKENMRKRKAEMIQEYKNDKIEITPKLHDHILIMSSLDVGGEISDYVDEFVGISAKHKIGWGVNKNKDIVIKGSPIDLQITDFENKISEKDKEITQLKFELSKVK